MIKAKKSLGQNFLQDPEILEQIIQAAELKPDDQILEIGPGKGALTTALLEATPRGQVTAVELDDRLIQPLQEEFGHHKNFKLVHQDALTFTPPTGPYKIVANIPYYITSPLLNHYLLEQFLNREDPTKKSDKNSHGNPPQIIVFMVQKEVAKKIIAAKGKHSVLSLQVHIFGEPELICNVPASAFEPAPKVDSAVIRIRVHPEPKIAAKAGPDTNIKNLFWLLHMAFAQKRKKLTRNLANAFQKTPAEIHTLLESLDINPGIRAEALTLPEWKKLFHATRD
jgi:16S rRNA (adenine1518-N6/adenine1519-N6)-dimethyltransferase